MPYYRYKALSQEGKEVKGIKEAPSLLSLNGIISQEGLLLLEAEEVDLTKGEKKGLNKLFTGVNSKVSDEELALLLYEIGSLLEKNLHITKVFTILAGQITNKRLKDALLHIKDKVEQGVSLADAMEETGVFPNFVVEMVRAGETSGALDKVFLSASQFLERKAEFKSKLLNSLIYPSIVITVGIVAVFIFMTLVIPKVVKIYNQFGQELPLTAKFMVFLSSLLEKAVYILPLLALSLFVLKRKLLTKERLDKLSLKLPFFGKITLYSQIFIWANTMYLLLKGGLQMDRALQIANNTISNTVVKKALEPLVKGVVQGKQLSQLLKDKQIIPENILQLIVVGEETGQMDEIFYLIAQHYRKEIEKKVNLFLRYLEPAVLIAVSLLVGFFIFSILLPIFNITIQ
ncbi:MAG: type II secretion system F family protein [Aquificae bacterium]|nr:type II secretion system F family protein [Aquificota bacterium]